MAGDKKDIRQAAKSAATAIKRGADGGKVSSMAGQGKTKTAAELAAEAAAKAAQAKTDAVTMQKEKDAAEAARKAGAEANKKKKKSAADIFMGSTT